MSGHDNFQRSGLIRSMVLFCNLWQKQVNNSAPSPPLLGYNVQELKQQQNQQKQQQKPPSIDDMLAEEERRILSDFESLML
jgi:hypothetical protein